LPDGFVYKADFISAVEEEALIAAIEQLEFGEIRMHGVVAKRRVVHFGQDYAFDSATITPGAAMPEFLAALRLRVGEFAQRAAEDFAEVLVTEYPAGAGIGWHRDAPAFDIVVGVSLLGECTMQFRPWPAEKNAGRRTQPLAQVLERRSVYILRGASRTGWQHHIPEAKTPRFSITFRTLRRSHPAGKEQP
jgi:alkylated DNA repair dioxygenase AlkB